MSTADQKSILIQSSTSNPPQLTVTEKVSGISVDAILPLIYVLLLCIVTLWILIKLHKKLIILIEFLVSVPIYKRGIIVAIGVVSTITTPLAPKNIYYLPFILGYVVTFAFNEFASKKDIEKAKDPLEKDISEKEKLIESFRKVIEDKKNAFHSIIYSKISNCHRVRGKNDSEQLKNILKNIENLQDIILAEKTFMETPDEALRRLDNSTSGNPDLASQTMVNVNANDEAGRESKRG